MELSCDCVCDGGLSIARYTTQEEDTRNAICVWAIDPLDDFSDDFFASTGKTSLVGVKTSTPGVWHVAEVGIHSSIDVD